jgi:hypothetical protein
MKKIGLIILVVVLALGALGIAYATWSQSLNVNADVYTGTLAATITPNGIATSTPTYLVVASETASGTQLYLTVTHAVPGAVIHVPFTITNTGTIPCNIAWGGATNNGAFTYSNFVQPYTGLVPTDYINGSVDITVVDGVTQGNYYGTILSINVTQGN